MGDPSVFSRAAAPSQLLRHLVAVFAVAAGMAISIPLAGAQPKQAAQPVTKSAAAPAGAASPASPAPAASPASTAWSVTCVSRGRAVAADCTVEQRVVAKETGQVIAIALVNIPGESRQPALLFQLPPGLFLQDAPTLRIDDAAPITAQYQSCDGRGCVISAPFTPALLAALKAGKSMTVQVTGINRDKLTFPYLLTDFTAAFDAAR